MFTTLLESGRRQRGPGRQSFVSFAIHLGLVFGAIGATRHVVTPASALPRVTQVVFVPPSPTPAAAAPASQEEAGPVMPAPEVALPTITPPVVAPPEIPPVTAGPPVDPKRLAAMVREPGPITTGIGGGEPVLGDGQVFLQAEADRIPEVAAGAECLGAYPAVMRSMGVPGRAVLEFVVEADGRVDPGTVRVVSATAPAFGQAAVEGVTGTRCRYRPGEYRGQPVRVLVRQAAGFRVAGA